MSMDLPTGSAYFVAGLFFANGIPHFVNGISGASFQSPFAKPPGVGESSAVVNVIWGVINFVITYGLLRTVDTFTFSDTLAVTIFLAGVLAAGLGLAWHFGRVRSRARKETQVVR